MYTFGELLLDWLSFTRTNVKESTFCRYKAMIQRHIYPELGHIPLEGLTTGDMDRFTAEKLRRGNLKEPGALSPKTVAGFLSVIRLALKFGLERGYCCPANLVVHNPRQNIPEIRILTREEQQNLEAHLYEEHSTISLGILLSLYLGLRIGEICALRWEDLDLESGVLSVQRSIQRLPDSNPESPARTKIVIDRPKTCCSRRLIPIPAFLLPILVKRRKPENFYVLTGNASYLEPRKYYRKYKELMKKCGLEDFNYHALRHTFATRCVENEFDIKSLSEILGHANVSTTLQKYVHPPLHLKRQYMDRLESVIKRDIL